MKNADIMTKIYLTERALDDLRDIYDYSVHKWGEQAALKYLQAFEDSFDLLRENSGLLRINKKISIRFYIYNVKKHYLICDIIHQEIFVLTVSHVSMNLLERLQDLEPQLDDEIKTYRKKLK